MKKIILFSLFIFGLLKTDSCISQDIIVKPTQANLGGDLNHAYTVFIDETTEKEVVKKWSSYTKKHKSKNSTKGEYVYSDNAYFSSISDDTLDIYATARKEGEGCELTVAFNLSGTFISYDKLPDLSDDASRVVYTFAYDLRKEIVKGQIKDAENEAKKRDKNYDALIRKNSNLHKEIGKFEQKIKSNEKEIINVQDELAVSKELLENQEAVLETLSGSVEEKEAKAELKKRKSNYKNLDKRVERLKSENEKLRNNIKDNERDIKQNVKDQKKAQSEIKEQEKVIKELEKKEKSIK